jgi:hypothetical protein
LLLSFVCFILLLSVYIYTCNSSCVQCTSVCLSFDFHRFRQFLFLWSPAFGVMLRTALSAGSIRWTAWFLSPPPPRSFGFFCLFSSPDDGRIECEPIPRDYLPSSLMFFGLGFGVFYCAWQWHARPDFFLFPAQQLNHGKLKQGPSLSLSPLLIVLFVNVSSFGTIRRSYLGSYPLADQQRHYTKLENVTNKFYDARTLSATDHPGPSFYNMVAFPFFILPIFALHKCILSLVYFRSIFSPTFCWLVGRRVGGWMGLFFLGYCTRPVILSLGNDFRRDFAYFLLLYPFD